MFGKKTPLWEYVEEIPFVCSCTVRERFNIELKRVYASLATISIMSDFSFFSRSIEITYANAAIEISVSQDYVCFIKNLVFEAGITLFPYIANFNIHIIITL